MLLSHFKKTFSLLEKKQKLYSLFVLFIFLVQMFLELFSVTLFIPLISFLTETDLTKNTFYLFFKNNLNIDLSYLLKNFKIFIIFFISVFLIRSLIILFCNWIKIKFTLDIKIFLMKKLYKKYLSLPYQKFISKNSSHYIKNMSYENDLVSEGVFQFLEFISESIVITGIFIFLLFFNLKLSIISFLMVATFFVIANLATRKKLKTLGDKVRNFEQLRLKNFIESFNLIKEIKIFNKQSFFENRNKNFNIFINDNNAIWRFLRVVPSISLEFILVILISSMLLIMRGEYTMQETLALLGVFLASSLRLLPSIKKIVTAIQYFGFSSPATINISNELSKKDNLLDSDKIKIKNLKKDIVFSNLEFKYENSEKYILKNFDLKISAGKITGIKGSTGSGKSTIVNLMSGLIFPTSGSLSIDQINYNTIDINSLHRIIGYVPQNIYLMDTSIKNNITFGAENISNEEIKNVLRKTNLEEFINSLPSKIETLIGEKSSKISGGQAQRIGIARALIKQPSILILDEATNSLDIKTEDQILQGIKKLKDEITIVIISHNENSLKICDKIINIDDLKKL